MPDKDTLQRMRADKRAGKSASTQAGEFVKQEMDHIREGRHGAKNAKQAIAIGLSEARRSGVAIPDKSKRATPAPSRKVKVSKRKNPAKSAAGGRTITSRKPAARKATSKRRSAASA